MSITCMAIPVPYALNWKFFQYYSLFENTIGTNRAAAPVKEFLKPCCQVWIFLFIGHSLHVSAAIVSVTLFNKFVPASENEQFED